MAGRFPLYTDADVHGPVVKALQSHYTVMGPGDFVATFEELAARDDPFAGYPILHIKPRR